MLQTLNYGIIESDQLLTFGKSIVAIFSGFDPAQDPYVLAPFVTAANNSYKLYSQAYERELKNPFTEKLDIADKKRDGAFYCYRDFVASFLYDEDDDLAQAAKRLTSIIYKHGWGAAYFGFKAETAALTNIINETKDFNMADVQLLGANNRFVLLQTRESEFENLQKESVNRPDQGLPTITGSRPVLVAALRKLMNMVDNHYSTSPDDAVLAGYMKAINETITLTMTTARAAETRAENKKKRPQQ
jgi:hypothetical protein